MENSLYRSSIFGFFLFFCLTLFSFFALSTQADATPLPISHHTESVSLKTDSATNPAMIESDRQVQGPRDLPFRQSTRKILHAIAGDDLQAFFGSVPSVKFFNSPLVDAFVDKTGVIRISSGLLLTLRSEDEYAFVLAHELAHLVSEDHRHHLADVQEDPLAHIRREIFADRYATSVLIHIGLRPSAGFDLLSRIVRDNPYISDMYPTIQHRLNALQGLEEQNTATKA